MQFNYSSLFVFVFVLQYYLYIVFFGEFVGVLVVVIGEFLFFIVKVIKQCYVVIISKVNFYKQVLKNIWLCGVYNSYFQCYSYCMYI